MELCQNIVGSGFFWGTDRQVATVAMATEIIKLVLSQFSILTSWTEN